MDERDPGDRAPIDFSRLNHGNIQAHIQNVRGSIDRMTKPNGVPGLFETAEGQRLVQARTDPAWRRWGPYLSDRQWGTVREDYSADGEAWDSLPHDHARSRAYRWGEDGIGGFGDRTSTGAWRSPCGMAATRS